MAQALHGKEAALQEFMRDSGEASTALQRQLSEAQAANKALQEKLVQLEASQVGVGGVRSLLGV